MRTYFKASINFEFKYKMLLMFEKNIYVYRFRPSEDLCQSPEYKAEILKVIESNQHNFINYNNKFLKWLTGDSNQSILNLLFFPSKLCNHNTSKIVNIMIFLKGKIFFVFILDLKF